MRLATWNIVPCLQATFSDIFGSDTYSRFMLSRRSQLSQPHSSTPIAMFITTLICLVMKSYTLCEAQVLFLHTTNWAIFPSPRENFLDFIRFPNYLFLTQVCFKKCVYRSSHWIRSFLALKRRCFKSGCGIRYCNFNCNTIMFCARHGFLLTNYYCGTAYI